MTDTVRNRLQLASRANRLLGQLLDGFVSGIPLIAGAILASVSHMLGAALVLIGVAWPIFYYLFGDGFPAAESLGKRWLGMRAVDATTGARPTPWRITEVP